MYGHVYTHLHLFPFSSPSTYVPNRRIHGQVSVSVQHCEVYFCFSLAIFVPSFFNSGKLAPTIPNYLYVVSLLPHQVMPPSSLLLQLASSKLATYLVQTFY